MSALRVLLVLVGLAVVGFAAVWAWLPKPQAPRVEAAVDVVGVDTGGSYAWILRTKNGAALIDAGLDARADAILDELRRQGIAADEVHTLLLTHGHRDHWAGASRFPNAKVYVGPGEEALVRGEHEPQSVIGALLRRAVPAVQPPATMHELKPGETLDVDGVPIHVIGVPGHSPGSVAYRHGDVLFTGDAVMGKGDRVILAPSFMSEDPARARESLRAVVSLPFVLAADGHTGVIADARQKVERLLSR